MKRPPTWFAASAVVLAAIGIGAAYLGGMTGARAAHALLGALSLLGVIGMWFLWLVLGSLDDSLTTFGVAATSAMLTLCLSGLFYFFGPSWPGVLTCCLVAPAVGGLAALRVAMWRTLARPPSPGAPSPPLPKA